MFKITSRKCAAALGALALILLGAALWLSWAWGWFDPAPTKFGWPATLTTVAGSGERGLADGPGAGGRFGDPFALARDRKGRLYVADDTRVRRIEGDGSVTTLPGTFDTPSGLAINSKGDVLVAETGRHTIRRIGADGTVTTLAGIGGQAGFRDGPAAEARFNGPIGVAADAKGYVYIADTYNDRIRLLTPDGNVRTLAGSGAPGFADGQGGAAAFDTPTGIALDRNGALLVADTGNAAIRKVTLDGQVSTLARSGAEDGQGLLQGVVGLAPTWDGYLYLASYARGRILQMSPTGALQVLAGPGTAIGGNGELRLIGPAALAVDRAGALYVADASAYAVRKLAPRDPDAIPIAAIPDTPLPSLVGVKPFPWPMAPQYGSHEVVGDMGEVRGNYQGESRDHLHAGLDISSPMGTTVLASAAETVRDPLSAWGAGELNEGLRIDQMTYIHMRVGRTLADGVLDPARFQLDRDGEGKLIRVRIRRGTRFKVGDPLGTINRMAHVHLELGTPRGKINALALQFPGFGDHVAPHIDDVHLLDAGDARLRETVNGRLVVPADSGRLSIVAEAWDQVDGNAERRRLGLYKAGFQVLHADGSPVRGFETPRVALEFDRMPEAPDAAKIIYAPASGDTVHSDQRTRFLYVVTNKVRHGHAEREGWDPKDLAPGPYIIRIYAADRAGNVAVSGRDLPILIQAPGQAR